MKTAALFRWMILVLLLIALPCDGGAKPGWANRALAGDPNEDASPCDWLEFYAQAEKEGGLRLAYRCTAPVNFLLGAAYSIYLDSDGRRDTGYRGSDDQFPLGADLLLQGATLYRYNDHSGYNSGIDWNWTSLGLVTYETNDTWADFALTAEQVSAATNTIHVILVGDNTATDVGGNFLDLFPDAAMKKTGAGATIQIKMKQ